MIDTVSSEVRSRMMAKIRSTETKPEKKVRSYLHRHGFRFRKNDQKLPGKPDIVLPKYKTVVFVHGCFWHQHKGCSLASKPKSRTDYWENKLARNIERDKEVQDKLESMGWKVIVLWECELENAALKEVASKIRQSL